MARAVTPSSSDASPDASPIPPRSAVPLVVWHFRDGKRGHDNQSTGLIEALSERTPLRVEPVDIASPAQGLRAFGFGGAARRIPGPDPHLLVGAGHATHVPMLLARRARGGRIVCLMRPSLPPSWFDLCVVPRHDRPSAGPHVFVTEGPLHRLPARSPRRADTGLILLGGPSRHFHWDAAALLEQIETILARDRTRTWTIATSRRTPADLAARLRARGGVEVVEPHAVPADWLPGALAEAGAAWVTADSASMLFEAVSAGVPVGLLELRPKRPGGKLARAAADLVTQGRVTPFAQWTSGAALAAPAAGLDEARRCAQWILRRWFGAG